MIFRKLYLKIKRKLFYKSFGFYPEDIKKLVYVQKYLEHNRRTKTYQEYLSEKFVKDKYENKCNN